MKQQNHRSAASGSVDRTRGLQDRPAIIKTIKPEKCESRGRKKRKVSQLISVLNCDRNLKIMASGTHRFDEDGFMAERAPVQRYRQFWVLELFFNILVRLHLSFFVKPVKKISSVFKLFFSSLRNPKNWFNPMLFFTCNSYLLNKKDWRFGWNVSKIPAI